MNTLQNRLDHEHHYRPEIHFTPTFGWMNDPNGLVYLNGQYHLFYQYYPAGNTWGPMHWGHATSTDLTTWQHAPVALAPDELGMCFSGTATVDATNRTQLFAEGFDSGLLAFYTIAQHDKQHPENLRQSQGLAFSHDEGLTWQRYANNPVLVNTKIDDFRDPKVFWHEASQYWIMIITSGQQVEFYRSKNAVDWSLSSRFGSENGIFEGKHDDRAWECPDLFPLTVASDHSNAQTKKETLWVLIVGVQRKTYSGGSGTQYFIGNFDGETFKNIHSPETVLWLDYGRDFYACQTWADMPNSSDIRTGIAWMSNWLYANQVPTYRWRSMMSIPRSLRLHRQSSTISLQASYILKQHFAPQSVKNLPTYSFSTSLVDRNTVNADLDNTDSSNTGSGNKESVNSQSIAWQSACLIDLDLDFSRESTHQNRFKLTVSEDLYFEFYCENASLFVCSTRTGEIGVAEFDTHFPHNFTVNIGKPRHLNGQLLLDKGVTELLLDNGEFSISNLIFPASGSTQILIWETI